ncbi:hypothetical protein Dimus_038210 [Dionaea muscipula]
MENNENGPTDGDCCLTLEVATLTERALGWPADGDCVTRDCVWRPVDVGPTYWLSRPICCLFFGGVECVVRLLFALVVYLSRSVSLALYLARFVGWVCLIVCCLFQDAWMGPRSMHMDGHCWLDRFPILAESCLCGERRAFLILARESHL